MVLRFDGTRRPAPAKDCVEEFIEERDPSEYAEFVYMFVIMAVGIAMVAGYARQELPQ